MYDPVRQGSTPDLFFEVPGYDLTDKKVRLTFSAHGKKIMSKENDSLRITYDGISTIYVRLTQEETLGLPLGSIQVQLKWIGMDKYVPVTPIGEFQVSPDLDGNTIEY